MRRGRQQSAALRVHLQGFKLFRAFRCAFITETNVSPRPTVLSEISAAKLEEPALQLQNTGYRVETVKRAGRAQLTTAQELWETLSVRRLVASCNRSEEFHG
jgi:hypothetical protein